MSVKVESLISSSSLPKVPTFNIQLVCSGCGAEVPGGPSPVFKCPNVGTLPHASHALMPCSTVSLTEMAALANHAQAAEKDSEDLGNASPFIRYRALLYPYRVAIAGGMSDEDYRQLVNKLDLEVERLDGTGFRRTPLIFDQENNVFVKNETRNVAQSHKARHFFNLMVYLLVLETLSGNKQRQRLAVASCGNAALAAATIAKAANWPIDVCIPEDASAQVVERLQMLGADIHICPRGKPTVMTRCFGVVSTHGAADPTVGAFRNMVETHGSIPFSVQGSECGIVVEGGQTLAWEILEGVHEYNSASGSGNRVSLGTLYIQVGGGALGAGLKQGFERAIRGELALVLPSIEVIQAPTLVCVQPEGNAPLFRAFETVKTKGSTAKDAALRRPEFMFPWEAPTSIAHGLLDDETYDWVELVDGMLKTSGSVTLVNDAMICMAKQQAEHRYNIDACHTGSAGLAAMMAVHKDAAPGPSPSIVVLSGKQRDATSGIATAWLRQGIRFRRVENTYDPKALFAFNKEHGTTKYNFIPDGPVQDHFSRLATGKTLVWGAFTEASELVGLISSEVGGGYWLSEIASKDASWFISEFVVSKQFQGRGIGTSLVSLLVDPICGLFSVHREVKEVYTTVHAENAASRHAFLKAGFHEVVSYNDEFRGRATTVLKFSAGPIRKAAIQVPPIKQSAEPLRVLAIQSGNAIDGIDVGIFDFEPPHKSAANVRQLGRPLRYRAVASETYPFTSEERRYILRLRAMEVDDPKEFADANYKLGVMFADAALRLLKETRIATSTIALVSSHGQTVTGHPHWEMGDLAVIAQRTGVTVAGDFRPADVAAGGNGAPCTCTYDAIVLRPTSGAVQWRIAINVGGTSSMTFLPPWPVLGAEDSQLPRRLDPGLGVFFMDLTAKAIDASLEYDADGGMARGGTIHEALLADFLSHPYYQQTSLPIGVGPDDFPEALWRAWREKAQAMGVGDIDLLATLTELTARQIAIAAARFGGPHIANGATDDVLLRGGVCANSYFMERLRVNLEEQLQVKIPHIKTLDELGLDKDSWETAMYGMFGFLCIHNMFNFQPSCTGAAWPVVGGKIAPGDNFHALMNRVSTDL